MSASEVVRRALLLAFGVVLATGCTPEGNLSQPEPTSVAPLKLSSADVIGGQVQGGDEIGVVGWLFTFEPQKTGPCVLRSLIVTAYSSGDVVARWDLGGAPRNGTARLKLTVRGGTAGTQEFGANNCGYRRWPGGYDGTCRTRGLLVHAWDWKAPPLLGAQTVSVDAGLGCTY